ncbi:MAG: tRNA (adenosine(37)-N6)-threonylcarbamoyltransferase complex dimerization subunit type 1 TsaB [Clostridiales bacterium]|nr:tRNA (adenosine(37)-N6)-threonylcarbamoyltransferase complex dimerization subunit type 1 TsaB [Clostridiales bacterium]
MKILALDTSSPATTVAILEGEKLVAEYTINNINTHSQKLMPMIAEIIKSCKWRPEDIDVFGVSLGPGSFTGLRIGIATIKAMAQSLNKKVCGVSSLEVLAYNLMYIDGVICPIIDAQRDAVYTATYKWGANRLIQLEKPSILHIDELNTALASKSGIVYFVGDAVSKFRLRIEEKNKDVNIVFPTEDLLLPRAYVVGEITRQHALLGKVKNVRDITPVYMRKSHAECQYEERQLRIEKEKSWLVGQKKNKE